MKNFSVNVDGKEYWISRSIAVAVFVFRKIGNKMQVLVEKRGTGVDNSGKLCVPCGYLDYDETAEQAAVREVLEETGFKIEQEELILSNVNSSPKENRQNVSIHYFYFAGEDEDFDLEKAVGGEENEIESVQWLDVARYQENDNNLTIIYDFSKSDEWAFEHDERCFDYLAKYFFHY